MFQLIRKLLDILQAVVPSCGDERLSLAPLAGAVAEIPIMTTPTFISLAKVHISLPGSFRTFSCSSLTISGDLPTSDRFLCCLRHATNSKSPHVSPAPLGLRLQCSEPHRAVATLSLLSKPARIVMMKVTLLHYSGGSFPPIMHNKTGFRMHFTESEYSSRF